MAATLLLRLVGPQQSWGVGSRFDERETQPEPTKSGVIGIVAAALGRPREASIDDLAALHIAVRTDRPGRIEQDFHTVLQVALAPRADGKSGGVNPNPVVTRRAYLADAAFTVALEGDADLLREIDAALRVPRFPLFIGRRGFPPSVPIAFPDRAPYGPALREGDAEAVLRGAPLLLVVDPTQSLRLSVECALEVADVVLADQPDAGATFAARRFRARGLRYAFVDPRELPGSAVAGA